MKVQDLIDLCYKQRFVTLVIPHRKLPEVDSVRIAGRGSPCGDLISAKLTERGYDLVVRFESHKLLKWLEERIVQELNEKADR